MTNLIFLLVKYVLCKRSYFCVLDLFRSYLFCFRFVHQKSRYKSYFNLFSFLYFIVFVFFSFNCFHPAVVSVWGCGEGIGVCAGSRGYIEEPAVKSSQSQNVYILLDNICITVGKKHCVVPFFREVHMELFPA
jgi:hypothetical protein